MWQQYVASPHGLCPRSQVVAGRCGQSRADKMPLGFLLVQTLASW